MRCLPQITKKRGKAELISELHDRLANAIKICREHVKSIIAPYAKADQAKRLYEWIAFLRESAVIIEIQSQFV